MILNEIPSSTQIGFPVLSTLILLPLLVAVGLRFLRDDALARRLAIGTVALELVLATALLLHFIPGITDFQFTEQHQWIKNLGISYHLGVDGISVLFIPLTALVTLMVLLLGGNGTRFMSRAYLSAVLALMGITVGIYASLDLILFYVFFELALVPMYLMIKLWGVGLQRQHASLKYILYMLVGSAALLIGIILLGVAYQSSAPTGTLFSFDLVTLLSEPVPGRLQELAFFLMLTGFAIKGPLLPFHTWLPSALMHGPVGAGMFLMGLKVGAYGILRFVLPLLPDASLEWSWLVIGAGLTALLYGALIALVQQNLRRLLAFASISHVGLVMVGFFSMNAQSIQGGLLLMVNMGLATTGLLFLAGALHARLGSSDLSAAGGIARQAPKLAFFFFLFGAASIGLPGTSGFHGEFLTMLGAFVHNWQVAAIGVIGVVLSAGYFLWYYERAFFGPVTQRSVTSMRDLTGTETAIVSAVALIILVIGIYPAPVMNATGASVVAVEKRLQASIAAAGSLQTAMLPKVAAR